MVITTATLKHLPYFTKRDHHISVEMLRRKLEAGEILIAKDDSEIMATYVTTIFGIVSLL
jgi:hypothetical protein